MGEVTTFQCDGCDRYQLHLPGGLHWVDVEMTVQHPHPRPNRVVKKRVQFCDRCLDRAEVFTFHRGFETAEERKARKAAADAHLKEDKPKEKRKDADTKPGT